MKQLCVIVFCIVASLCGGCSREQRPRNIVLITVDTLRPDRLGYAGNPRATSPVLDGLAARGVVYRNAYSVSGWTLPSIASIMTGRYPRDHGATDFHWSMDAVLPTLAGMLGRSGYDTRGYVSHVILKPEYGIADGFGAYDFSVLGAGHPHDVASGAALTDIILSDLADIKVPYFLWVHYFDPHFVYLPHAAWRQFGDDPLDRYDQEIAYTDREVGRLLDGFAQHGLDDNTVVIFTSDHGEEFGEHGGQYHYTLYDEVMRVPLIITGPGIAPAVDDRVVEQVDFVPTILQLTGVASELALPGFDILAPAPSLDRPVFMERDRPPPWNQRAIRVGHHKLTVVEYADTASIPYSSRGTYVEVENVVPGIYMYDLADDPAERVNIFAQDDSLSLRLLAELARYALFDGGARHEVKIDAALQEKLRSLGYIK